MGKSKILIAVCVVMVAAVFMARAEEMSIDFDGGVISNHSLSLTGLRRALPDFETALLVPTATGDAVKSEAGFYKLGEAEQKSLRQTIRETASSVFEQKILLLINDEQTDILYNNEEVFFVIMIDENKYKTLLESDDSRLIRFLSAVNNQAMPQTKQLMSPVTVCNLVEVFGGAYIMRKVGEIWEQVWVETVKLVKVCHTEYVEAPDNSAGQGGPISWPVRSAATH